MIGAGKEMESLQDLCEDLRLRTSIEFTGSLFGAEKLKLLQEAEVFAHPSRTDGLPATILEAASLGLPCLVSHATNMGGFIDEFDAGCTMKSLEALEFCKGLNVLYERIRLFGEGPLLAANALRMIDTAFEWTAVLEKFDGLYRKALEQPPGSAQSSQAMLNLA